MVWKFKSKDIIEKPDGELSLVTKSRSKSVIADLALFSFMKVIAKIHKLEHIIAYNDDERLLAYDQEFCLKMGFGLNVGWAIEGAIGS